MNSAWKPVLVSQEQLRLVKMIVLLVSFSFNIVGLILYLRYAQRKALLDQPNARSSHQIPTVRGGGVLFAPTFVLGILWFYPTHYLAAIAVLLAASISFLDDVTNLSARIRLPLHFAAVALLIMDTHWEWSAWQWLVGLILITGWMNTFNFMDGINGITSVYGSVFLLSLWLSPSHLDSFSRDALYFQVVFPVLLAILVFSFFNFRKKAICFAGDVGSVGLALIIAWFFLVLWEGKTTFYLLLFPAVYAVDSVMTIAFRLARRENIFKPHRSHLYQLLANEQGWEHRIVALLYGGLQVLLNVFASWYVSVQPPAKQLILIVSIYASLCLLYVLAKNVLEQKKINIR